MNKNVLVLGLGKVGSLVALLLRETGFNVTGVDHRVYEDAPVPMLTADLSDTGFLLEQFRKADAVVSCLPYHLNKPVVQAAYDAGVHYFDLTEDVPTANFIRKLSVDARAVFAPQCGLAPGFIAIVGASMAREFDSLRSILLRVGALPQSPQGLLGYAFNWSPEGVVNQYLNDCEVIQNGQRKLVPAMQDLETIVIEGKKLEAFTTSGGLGTMAETFDGKVDKLNYKTIRYPGHQKVMRFYFHELLLKDNRQLAGEILVNALPPVNNDVVYVYAAVDGWKNQSGRKVHLRDEFVRAYYPKMIGGQEWRAISWTTACSVCAVVELVFSGKLPLKGFLRQEDIPLDDFLQTQNGRHYLRQSAG